jgi:RND family efflux transporter MFP subunit
MGPKLGTPSGPPKNGQRRPTTAELPTQLVVGRVARVHVKQGDTVKAGALLFELDPADQRSAIASAQAKVAAARAKTIAARANYTEVNQQLEREKRLAQAGAIPQATADDLAARAKALEEQARASEAEAQASDAEVAALSVALRNLTISAPIDGTILTRPVEPGTVVGPQNDALVEMADFSSLVVETDVPEARLGQVKPKGPCEIILDAFPDKRYRGAVFEVTPRLNRAKATATVKVKFVDAAALVLPEMAARVSFLAQALDEAQMKEPPKLIIPATALAERSGAKAVFVLDNGKVRMNLVKLGAPFGNGFELKEGPPAGTRVVKDPPASLADGQIVKERSES